MGTYLSALKCLKCPVGFFLPEDTLEDSCEWSCESCGAKIPNDYAIKVNEQVAGTIQVLMLDLQVLLQIMYNFNEMKYHKTHSYVIYDHLTVDRIWRRRNHARSMRKILKHSHESTSSTARTYVRR